LKSDFFESEKNSESKIKVVKEKPQNKIEMERKHKEKTTERKAK
jgi:hypothetical protein